MKTKIEMYKLLESCNNVENKLLEGLIKTHDIVDSFELIKNII